MAKGPQLTQRKIDKLRDALNVVRETDQLQERPEATAILSSAIQVLFLIEDDVFGPGRERRMVGGYPAGPKKVSDLDPPTRDEGVGNMTDQFTLGEVLKSAGMARADEAEPNEWKARADQAIAHLASFGEPFTAEDVRNICGDPEHVNAFGSRLAYAARKGTIRPVGFEEAERPSRHRAVLRIWVGA